MHTSLICCHLLHNLGIDGYAMHAYCITTSLLGVDVDFATRVAAVTWRNSRVTCQLDCHAVEETEWYGMKQRLYRYVILSFYTVFTCSCCCGWIGRWQISALDGLMCVWVVYIKCLMCDVNFYCTALATDKSYANFEMAHDLELCIIELHDSEIHRLANHRQRIHIAPNPLTVPVILVCKPTLILLMLFSIYWQKIQ